MNGNDRFLNINDAHLRVMGGNVHASSFNLDQISITTTSTTASTIDFLNETTAFRARSNIEVGTANLFVNTETSNVGIRTSSPEYALDVRGPANVSVLTASSNVGVGTFSPEYTLDVHGTANVGALTATTFSGSGAGLNSIPSSAISGTLSQWIDINTNDIHYSAGNVGIGKTPDSGKKLDVDGTVKATTFEGEGSALTALNAANITTGTLDAARVPTPTTFTTADFSGDVTVDTDTFHVDTTNKRVGVGTVSPLSELEIYKATGVAELLINTGTVNPPTIRLWNFDDNNYNNHAAGTSVGHINFSGNESLTGEVHTDDTRAYSYANTLYDWARISAIYVGSSSTSTSQGYVRGDLAFYTNNGDGATSDLQERMRIKHNGNVGIGTTDPKLGLHAHVQYSIFGLNTTGSGIICDDVATARWRQTTGSYHLTFQRHNSSSSTNYTSWESRGYLHKDNGNNIMNNFTGQHRTFIGDVPFTQAESKEGLIVSANSDTYIKMSGGIAYGANAITINECLPVVTLSKTSNDKACFGVISLSEDSETREDAFGTFVSVAEKEKGDTRVFINSVGEGGIWITNKNGTLESGDYVTTSTILGYGVKQEDDILHNYTVAKITMNCNFNPTLQKVKRIKKKLTDVKYWVYVSNVTVTKEQYDDLQPEFRRIIQDDDGNDIYQTNDRTEWTHNPVEEDGIIPFTEIRNELQNDLDEHGQIQWEDTDDFEKAYKIRYILADATQISESEYDAKIATGEEAYKAAFVGCTYHCG
jgi:hypothetical protein